MLPASKILCAFNSLANSFLLTLLAVIVSSNIYATKLSVENVRFVSRDDVLNTPLSVIFDLKWDNSWNNEKNHDAAWVFMKYTSYWDGHVKIKNEGHKVLQNRIPDAPTPKIEVSEDGMGFFIYPSEGYRGDQNYKLQIMIDTSGQSFNRSMITKFKVFALEMVYIPQGSFYLGSPDEAAIKRAALYKSDEDGKSKGLWKVESEAAINIGPNDNELYYWSEEMIYNGDQQGPLPTEFPKGFEAFYIMKYELTQGQYADFLNCLPGQWTYDRSPIGGKTYYKNRGTIRVYEDKYVASVPNRPMNYVGFTDGLAYSDWAGLRPITELEYTKAARGSRNPVPAEFVWGTNNYDYLERYVNEFSDLTLSESYEEEELDDENLAKFGASYYWVMDMSGSVWEKVITVGNPIGRAFKGTHGDGMLDFGEATNEDWPKSDNEVGGFGYRGGGYYSPGTYYSDFNPHSPTGYRYYGAWSGGPRSIAYGYRAGRTAD